jgi:membrane-bound ClpP family serine protease
VQALASALFIVAALVNLAPLSGLLSVARMEALYGMAFEDPNLLILMRHRAILFGIVGGMLLVAAFHAPLRSVAAVAGLISMLTFVVLVWMESAANPQLRWVAWVDLAASVALVAGVLVARMSDVSGAN